MAPSKIHGSTFELRITHHRRSDIMTKTIHFNTGRLYTANGQRITATRHDDGIVTFYDHDRHIDGEFMFQMNDQKQLTQINVMSAYDRGAWKSTFERSYQDAFSINGCNAMFKVDPLPDFELPHDPRD